MRVLSLTQPIRPRSTHSPVRLIRCGRSVKAASWGGRVGWVTKAWVNDIRPNADNRVGKEYQQGRWERGNQDVWKSLLLCPAAELQAGLRDRCFRR